MKKLRLSKKLFLTNKSLSSAVICSALLFFLACNNKFLRQSATPASNSNLTYSQKLKYIVETGDQDRRSNLLRFFIFTNGKKVKSVWKRDSARCAYLLNLMKDSIPKNGRDKMNAGLILLHGNGELTCKDTILLLKAMYYFKDLKEHGPGIGDTANGKTWYPLAERRYNYLSDACRSKKPKEYTELCIKADSLYKMKDFKNSAFTYSAAFKTFGWKASQNDRYNAACSWAKANYADSAFSNLMRLATKMKFAEYNRVKNDTNLISLHEDKRWEDLLKKIKHNRK